MKAVKIRNVVFGEGIPKICIPLTDTDLKGLKQSVKAMKSAPFDFVEWRADFYQNIEKGENDLQIDRCIKLSKYFDVSTDYILKGEVSDCREFQLYFESLSGREKKREFDILLNKTFSK